MADERAELQRMLADAEARLEALPLVHQVKHQHSVIARRIALQAKIDSLRERLSTAPVHKYLQPGDAAAAAVDDGPCLDGAAEMAARVPRDDAQPDPQADLQPDLQQHDLSTDSTSATATTES